MASATHVSERIRSTICGAKARLRRQTAVANANERQFQKNSWTIGDLMPEAIARLVDLEPESLPEHRSMPEPPPFEDLLRRVRAGDENAATELVRIYEPSIRRIARLRLANAPLTALLDSTDICQSVMASFFVRMNLGQYSFESPEQLIKLLAAMARGKLAAHVRRETAQRRDRRRMAAAVDDGELVGAGVTPSREVAARDLLENVRGRLSPDERQLVELRDQGRDWGSVANEVGGSPDALRMKLTRAIDRVARELGIEDHL